MTDDEHEALRSAAGDFEARRIQHLRMLRNIVTTDVAKRTWTAEQFAALRIRRLQRLLRHAQENSPWHRERLRGIDPRDVDERSLRELPTMSKSDLMQNWDDIVVDRRLTLAMAEDAIDRARHEQPAYLLGEYQAIASGGSTGARGVFVWDFEGLARGVALAVRFQRWVDQDLGAVPTRRLAHVQATNPGHASNLVARCFGDPGIPSLHLSPALPVEETVRELNAFAPTHLVGYPSVLHVLAQEALEGRLRIHVQRIQCQAEALLEETADLLREAFGVPVLELYGASECTNLAVRWPGEDHLRQVEDHVVIEALGAHGHPTAVGEPSTTMLITNTINTLLPLIRYELNDEITYLENRDDGGSRPGRACRVAGRRDDVFTYDETAVHPHVLRTVLGRRDIAEYQVRQTPRGVEVSVRPVATLRTEEVEHELRAALRRAGLVDPVVAVEAVEAVTRNPNTGKLRRFVPLETPS